LELVCDSRHLAFELLFRSSRNIVTNSRAP